MKRVPLLTSLIFILIIGSIVIIIRPLFASIVSPFLFSIQHTPSSDFSQSSQFTASTLELIELRKKAQYYDEIKKHYIIGDTTTIHSTSPLVTILSRPQYNPYGTFLIGAGKRDNVTKKSKVYFDNVVVLGAVDTIYSRSSLIVPYWNPGKETHAYLNQRIPVTLVGMGNGSFEFSLPEQVSIKKNDIISQENGDVIASVVMVLSGKDSTLKRVIARTPFSLNDFTHLQIRL